MAHVLEARRPIEAETRVSEVLARHPDLLEVFVRLSPAFGRLRNPLIRKVQTRLVTVAQAARVAGIEPAELIRTLNEAAGLSVPTDVAFPMDGAAHSVDLTGVEVAVLLDVRPLLAEGKEPFSAITTALRDVPRGNALRLRCPFEPVPFYDVVGRRGFVHYARKLGRDDWDVLFVNTGRVGATRQPASRGEPESPSASGAPAATVTIDVADLVPPEPMVRILLALDGLEPGETLRVEHRRRPVYLYPHLDALGCTHETRDLGPDKVELLIRKPQVHRDTPS